MAHFVVFGAPDFLKSIDIPLPAIPPLPPIPPPLLLDPEPKFLHPGLYSMVIEPSESDGNGFEVAQPLPD
ncbi:hypothetical protein D9758_005303 [Tetrapyrgos nigripes]|uniref:Uncharacterized protein n=1 Tax=Tetrapyrgos nigripes TaxID=182062 RepID=A0A8H5GX44_9AGAR|nr:hypothetical protein D9758_005303 [Tetrapyrgos nigripes]